MAGHDLPLAECEKDHEAFKRHVEESGPVRLMVERHELQIAEVDRNQQKSDKLLERVSNRLPLWATFMISALFSTVVGLGTFLITHR